LSISEIQVYLEKNPDSVVVEYYIEHERNLIDIFIIKSNDFIYIPVKYDETLPKIYSMRQFVERMEFHFYKTIHVTRSQDLRYLAEILINPI